MLGVARSRSRLAATARTTIFVVPLALALTLRAHQALATPDVLDWDETYYLSTAVTAAHGHGLYPYIFGFGPTRIMGGYGYAVYVYAFAVWLFGPSLLALRAVSLVGSIAGLAGMWLLVRTLYGSAAGWMAAALTATMSLFMMSNTARMDAWTFAWVAWALVLFAIAVQRWSDGRLHLLAGAIFGLGLQVHIDTVVTALACGALYVGWWLREVGAARRFVTPVQPLLFLAGWSIGLLVFVGFNVLPDPASFYKTTVLFRLDVTRWYSHGTSSILGSFLDPRILVAKEASRYAVLARMMPTAEVLLAAAAFAAAIVRRNTADRIAVPLVLAVLALTPVVLNNATPLYFIHVAPALMIPLAPLFTHGLTPRSNPTAAAIGMRSLLAFIFVVTLLAGINDGPLERAFTGQPLEDPVARDIVRKVHSVADRRCKIAGDGALYARYLADYPYFVSSRPTEVGYGMLYYGITREADYWAIKRPDIVFGPPLPDGLAAYLSANGFSEPLPRVWVRRGGCEGGP